ncbi:MAG TPA: SDR family NAD(P)-dependent oxidoreductase [Candidatus Dormibacteraeota bacterium]|nr:SDR family NAD(P)-dependent oxidoreductase [Candidatus Dormibacteraeota bacterium]
MPLTDARHVVVTGATNGIGRVAAIELARRGAALTIVARSPARAAALVEHIQGAGGRRPAVVLGDLGIQADVRRIAAEVLDRGGGIDALVNNAGAVHLRRALTPDGIERTWATNHLAPFLLTALLLDAMRGREGARVITTASDAHRGAPSGIRWDDVGYARRRYRGFAAYAQSKLANILFTRELGRRLEGSGVTALCLHPGFVATGFNRNNGAIVALGMRLLRPVARSPERGADTLVWLADGAASQGPQGAYFVDRRLTQPSGAARDAEAAERLWALSEEQTGAVPALG